MHKVGRLIHVRDRFQFDPTQTCATGTITRLGHHLFGTPSHPHEQRGCRSLQAHQRIPAVDRRHEDRVVAVQGRLGYSQCCVAQSRSVGAHQQCLGMALQGARQCTVHALTQVTFPLSCQGQPAICLRHEPLKSCVCSVWRDAQFDMIEAGRQGLPHSVIEQPSQPLPRHPRRPVRVSGVSWPSPPRAPWQKSPKPCSSVSLRQHIWGFAAPIAPAKSPHQQNRAPDAAYFPAPA